MLLKSKSSRRLNVDPSDNNNPAITENQFQLYVRGLGISSGEESTDDEEIARRQDAQMLALKVKEEAELAASVREAFNMDDKYYDRGIASRKLSVLELAGDFDKKKRKASLEMILRRNSVEKK